MNSEVEQRIVAMYFDNKDFEKNAKKTIDTLGELKDNLNLEDSVKGFEELNKAGKKLNLNDARTAVRNLRDSLGGLGEKIKNALNIGSGPLHTMRGFFDEFNGYVTKVAGIDLAGKIVNSFENAFRQLTTAPIEAGWNMYQQNVDSTKTIMSGTLQSYKKQMSEANSDWTYNEAEHMEYVKGQLKELSDYAQKTVFSLSDMTSNVGKFTNNNIDLETSVTAMEGIANMTAKAGQGAQQASMAMYNISQALGVGKMTTIDWKSIENANIATTELKDLFIQTAAAGGKLTKQIKKGADGKDIEEFFITVDKNGKKLAKNKWVKISAENFRDTLSEGWLDKETMLRVFQLYSNQVKDIDTLSSWGFDTKNKELVEYLFGIGEEAELAATQVRTFQKMWDAMTESVQSGWATSMEYIFGDMQEATTFWSTINEKIGSVLDASAKNRNDMLKEWRGYTYNENTKEWEKLQGAIDGREDLIQGIYGTIDAAKSLGSAFTGAWSDVFGNLTGKKLQEITKGFRDFIDRFKGWLGDMNDAGSRIRKIRTGLSGVFSVIKVIANVIKTGLGLALRVVKPLIDPILNLFERFGKGLNLDGAKNLGEMLSTLRERFTALWKKLTTLGFDGVFKKIGEWFSNLWEKIKIGVSDFLDDNGLSGVKEWFVSVGDRIQEGYEVVKSWWNDGDNPVANFFKGIYDFIASLFATKNDNGDDIEMPIVTFFRGIYNTLVGAWESVFGENGTLTKWWNGGDNVVANFFTGVYDSVASLFATKNDNGDDIEMPIVTFFRGIYNKIVSVWESIFGENGTLTKWWNDGDNVVANFFTGVYDSVASLFATKNENGDDIEMPIVTFFNGIYNKIVSVWESVFGENGTLTKWWNGGDNAVANFFKGVYDSVAEMFAPVTKISYDKNGAMSIRTEAPIVTFFRETWEGIKGIFEEIQNSGILEQIGDFFSRLWSSFTSIFSGGDELAEVTEAAEPTKAADTVKKVVGSTAEMTEAVAKNTPSSPKVTVQSVSILERIVNAISGFIQEVFKSINGVVIPPEVTSFFENLGKVLLSIMDFFGRIFGHISKMFNSTVLGGKEDATTEWIVAGVIGLIAVFQQVFSYLNNANLAKIGGGESFAAKFMSLGLGILAIASAIALLTTIDQGKMWSAVGAVAVIGGVLAGIMAAVAANTRNRQGLAAIEGKTEIWTKLIGAIEKIALVAIALKLLPEIIRAFADAKKQVPELEGTDIMNTLMGLAVAVSGISLALGVVQKITANQGIDPAAAIKTAFAIAGFFGALVTGFGLIGGLTGAMANMSDKWQGAESGATVKSVTKSLEDGGEILKSIGKMFNSFVGGLFGIKTDGEKIAESQEILSGIADGLEIFTSDKSSGILRVLNLIGALAQITQDAPDATKVSNFADALEPLAIGISRFNFTMQGWAEDGEFDAKWSTDGLEANVEKVRKLLGVVGQISDMPLNKPNAEGWLSGLKVLTDETNGMTPELADRLASFIVRLRDALNKAMGADGEATVTLAQDLVKNVSNAIKVGLSEGSDYEIDAFDATPIVDSVVKALGYGETAIATAVHDMVQAGLDKSDTPEGSGTSGYKFDPTSSEFSWLSGFMQAANDPNSVFKSQFENDELMNYVLYGEGGSESAPTGGIIGQFSQIEEKVNNYKFNTDGMYGNLGEIFQFKDPETGENLDIAAELRTTLDEVQTQIDQMPEFKITIVPTFDYRNLNTDAIRNALREYPIGFPGNFGQGGTVKVDMTELGSIIDTEGLKSAIANVSATVDASQVAIVAAINSVEDRIGSLSSAISNIKLYLDTGVLVGGITPLIDIELGRRARRASSTGVASTFGNPFAYMLNKTDKP